MEPFLAISKQSPSFPEYLDFQKLRATGIDHLQKLSGQIWTDYNLHDPGVTILEVLCYAVTDLGYRNSLETKDLLARDPQALVQADGTPQTEDNFFTPDEILSCNPVTALDIRKRLIDIQGVRNAWIEKLAGSEPEIYVDRDRNQLRYTSPTAESSRIDPKDRLAIRGLYSVLIDLAPVVRTDACGQNYQPWESVMAEVNAVLHSHRNLCEDIYEVVVLGEEEIGLKTDIEIAANADAETVLAEIYIQVQHFLAPSLRFYTLQALLAQGKSTADIFAGRPSALPKHDPRSVYDERDRKSHGFVDIDELKAYTLPTVLHTSDLYKIILNVDGVIAIKNLEILSWINGIAKADPQPWYLHLSEHYRPVLGVEHSRINLFKQGVRVPLNEASQETIKRRYEQQKIVRLKAQRDAYELDLAVPQGTYYDSLDDHYSIHHEFPLTYGIGEVGLPQSATRKRKAQAKQLQEYLLFFDQILANYLKQLSQVRTLFSWDKDQWHRQNGQQHTYVSPAKPLDFPGFEETVQQAASYPAFLQDILEDPLTADARRHKLLDHLLARFAENFTDYVLVNYQLTGNAADPQRLQDKADFLKQYPIVSRDRFRALNYTQLPQGSRRNISGFQQRLERLLGIASQPDASADDERFYLIEHVLLRPRVTSLMDGDVRQSMLPINTDWSFTYGTENPAAVDPYSFWVSILFPSTPKRYQDPTFRQLIERTVRIEAPAHVAVKIGWFNPQDMAAIKTAYNAWACQLAFQSNSGQSSYCLTRSLNDLVALLSRLRSEYPAAVLASAAGEIDDKDNRFILGQSRLGGEISD